MTITSRNPATGQALATYTPHSADEVETRLVRAAERGPAWAAAPVAERARLLAALAQLLDQEKEALGRLMTLEMGKTLRSAVEEAAKCALGCRYYAENAERFLAPEPVERGADGFGEVRFRPLGAVLAIMPWNFPFWQVIRFAAPAVAAGNVGLLKHASNVPQCALALEDLFTRAGFPRGVFQTVLVESDRVASLIADPRVAAVTLTGSEPAGRAVAAKAGHHLKKTVLELGGSDPFIVTASADVERAADVAVAARIVNNGQSCIAAKRFIVDASVADAFERRFTERMAALRVGDPLLPDTDIGPLATEQIARDLEGQVRETVAKGADLRLGGGRLDRPGNYFAPTVLANVPRGSPAAEQELFGPVASIFRVRDSDEAIALANDSSFGLGASVWTSDDTEADRFANQIESGLVFINGMVASDPRFPFGGVKSSGYGRELGPWGLREFVNVKTVRRVKGATAVE
ncbi:MAG TPA: NAD-dependent succinate-semialdehyde dehydrogenase [Gemmatimonadaceae bacterium]|nr:NAD-dependent succinate-semialdehyde dehydrogenase [Gemmatimonadaceae bacterium]